MSKRRGHGEGGIHQRPDGRWEARLDLGWVEGKRKRISVYGRTRKEVADQLRLKQAERDNGLLVLDQRLTVGRWLDHWVESILPTRVFNGTLAQSTFSSYADIVRLHLKPNLGRIRVARLTHADVDALLASKRDAYSANSLRLMRSTLRKALADAERNGVVTRNAVALSEPIHVSLRVSEWLDEKKARSLLKQVESDRLEALYIVCLSLGLRRGEALGLQWEDVDLDRGTVLIRGALKRVKFQPLPDGSYHDGRRTGLVLGSMKTEDSYRTQNLPRPCVDALRRHRLRQRTEQLAASAWDTNDFVFKTTVGTPIDPRNFAKWLSAHCVNAELGHRNPHQLRHSAASILLAQGIPLHEVSDYLGHSSVRLTKDVYGHLSSDRRRAAADAVGEALWGEATEPETHSG